MRKLVLFIIACLITISIQAQEHLRFMGIELKGTITNFQTKLQSKGLKVSPLSREQPNGVRVFEGNFSGTDAYIYVFYNEKTKEVYRAKAVIMREGKDLIEQLMQKFETKLDTKYGTINKYSELIEDEYMQKFTQHGYIVPNGTITLFITSTSYIAQSTFFLHIDYTDKDNSNKNTQEEMDDL